MAGLNPIPDTALTPRSIYLGEQTNPFDEPVARSYLDTPVYQQIKFLPTTWTDNQTGDEVTTRELTIPEPIVAAQQQKTIVETPVTGLPEPFREYINGGQLMFSVEFMLFSDPPRHFQYPRELVRALLEIFQAPTPVLVTGRVFDVFDVSEVVVKQYNIPAPEQLGHQPVTCQLARSLPIELNPAERLNQGNPQLDEFGRISSTSSSPPLT